MNRAKFSKVCLVNATCQNVLGNTDDGIKGKHTQSQQLIDTDNSIMVAREKGGLGEVEKSKVGVNHDGRRLDLR